MYDRSKPIFWFRSHTKTTIQNGRYFQADVLTTWNHISSHWLYGVFFHHKRALKTKFAAKSSIVSDYFRKTGFIFKLLKTHIPKKQVGNMRKKIWNWKFLFWKKNFGSHSDAKIGLWFRLYNTLTHNLGHSICLSRLYLDGTANKYR